MSAASRILLSIVAIVVAAGAIAAWVIRGPGPIDFAGSQTVARAHPAQSRKRPLAGATADAHSFDADAAIPR